MGCFKFCFGTFNKQKVTPKKILIHNNQQKSVNFEAPTKPIQPIEILKCAKFESKDEYDFELNSSSIKEVISNSDVDFHKEDLIQKVVEFVVDNNNDNKEKECDIGNSGNGDDKMLENEREREDEIEEKKSLDIELNLEEAADLVVPEESCESMFSLSSESRKQLRNADENGGMLVQEESSDSLFSVSVDSKKCDELVKEESSGSLFSVSVGSEKQVNAAEDGDRFQEESSDSLFSLSVGSRKQANEAETSASLVQEESSGSLFSVSVGSRKQVNAIKIDENQVEVTSPITFGLNHIMKYPNPIAANSVLNPVENLTQWKKAIKATSDTCTDFDDYQKENVSPVQGHSLIPFSEEEPSLKKLSPISKQRMGRHLKVEGSDLAVDTSLSNWLVKSDKKHRQIGESSDYTEVSSTSSKKLEDRLVLTAMTIEDLKQHSVTSSLRRSPSRYSPDMIPMVGTVGSYLSHTGQSIMSSDSGSSHSRMSFKFRKDDNYHSTPLLQRLENA